ncbi:uncharacterized protein MKK02DRAFT_43019 [Dioszegia hungarica]|uniref:Uncharacterized protein n=1 Tax=Dioszegia hungarica TaxID=4972 RepID=A0AA38HDC7_9TREE|nr:uncharacterized protein MKK02DRAFT_43019 [Dioszegia hungarica]KAI9638620.1 hypothetical protein MKK02DRAFT_43019 [Dioszegia hungarica]
MSDPKDNRNPKESVRSTGFFPNPTQPPKEAVPDAPGAGAARPDLSGIIADEDNFTTIVRDGQTIRYRPAATPSREPSTSTSSTREPTSAPRPIPSVSPTRYSYVPSRTPALPFSLLTSGSTVSSSSDSVPEQARPTLSADAASASESSSSAVPEDAATISSSGFNQASPTLSAKASSVNRSSSSSIIPSSSSVQVVPLAAIESSSVVPSSLVLTSTIAPVPPSTLPLAAPSPSGAPPALTPDPAVRPSFSSSYIPPLPTDITAAANDGDNGSSVNKGTAAGAIAGSLLGCCALIALILLGIRWFKRRKQSDREALLRSSWFYGGDTEIPDDDDGDRQDRMYRQSHFSTPSIYRQSANRFSHFAASFATLNPLSHANRNTGRFPRINPLGAGAPAMRQRQGYNPTVDVPPPLPAGPSGQGGWASRFFANQSESVPVRNEAQEGWGQPLPVPGLYPGGTGAQQPNMIARGSPALRPAVKHPFAASPAASEEAQWGHSYSPSYNHLSPTPPAGRLSPPSKSSTSPTRDPLVRKPASSSSAYSGLDDFPLPPAIFHPAPRTSGSSQPSMEYLASTPTTDLTPYGAQAALLAQLSGMQRPLTETGRDHIYLPPVHTEPPLTLDSSLWGLDPSCGVSLAETQSVYSTNTTLFPGITIYQQPQTASGRGETMFSTASSDIQPLQRSGSGETTHTRSSYQSGTSGVWTSGDGTAQQHGAGSRETREWYNQPEWDEALARNAGQAAGMVARKSVKSVRWEDGNGLVDDGMPRAL